MGSAQKWFTSMLGYSKYEKSSRTYADQGTQSSDRSAGAGSGVSLQLDLDSL